VNCTFDVPDDLWAVEVDEGQINQVMFNLIINAVQAMPGGGTVHVKAENVETDEAASLNMNGTAYIKVTVEDHGVGIPSQNLQNIFDPYFTTKQKGNGLGLSTTYAIIKKHEGQIDVTSEVGSGTTFSFLLPALKGQCPPRRSNKQSILKGKGKVLLMDDDENILTTVSKTLERIGYSVDTVKDGGQAISLYRKGLGADEPYNVVIMDLTIREGMGGREAVEQLLKIDPDAKVIVSSGYSTDTVMANYRDYGFCEVITKPYQIESLSELLSKVITQHA
jgi:CheY-like chemotaxis protein